MSNPFFEKPILNSPYEYPRKHWKLDESGQSTQQIIASFNDDSILLLTPDIVGPSITHNQGIIGEGVDLSLQHLETVRANTLAYELTYRLIATKWKNPGQDPPLHLFGQLKTIARQWLDTCLDCKGGTYQGMLKYQVLADMACERITAAITRGHQGDRPLKAIPDVKDGNITREPEQVKAFRDTWRDGIHSYLTHTNLN